VLQDPGNHGRGSPFRVVIHLICAVPEKAEPYHSEQKKKLRQPDSGVGYRCGIRDPQDFTQRPSIHV